MIIGGTPANIEHVTFKVCANADSIVMDLQGGSIDMFARVTPAPGGSAGRQLPGAGRDDESGAGLISE